MRIQTMSIVVGTTACNSECPFCISKQTIKAEELIVEPDKINWRNFGIACEFANRSGVTTVLLTGKGEPTLYPHLITEYLKKLESYHIPFKELQTNGILIEKGLSKTQIYIPSIINSKIVEVDTLKEWYDLGLTTICLSIVSHESDKNHLIYQPSQKEYMNVENVIDKIHNAGFMVRLSCMMLKGYIDSTKELKKLIAFCKEKNVKQLTIRPINAPSNVDNEVSHWVNKNTIETKTVIEIQRFLDSEGVFILELAHGGRTYDIDGQNVCYATCMTTNKSTDDIRQIIFFPNGTLSYDWKYHGAVLL